MLKLAARLLVGLLSGVGVLSIATVIWLVSGGMSARRPPGAVETWVAVQMRSLAIPASDRQMREPTPSSPVALRSGMEQFADHCAVCHGNDGSGQADVGRGLYPRPPDMRSDVTQSMTDGEIFHIINDGVRFTGMPAWNHGASDTWALVRFIRHLPQLTKTELEQMRELNPRGGRESPQRAGGRRSR
jgi:mono/diheme cytochrome c family protein